MHGQGQRDKVCSEDSPHGAPRVLTRCHPQRGAHHEHVRRVPVRSEAGRSLRWRPRVPPRRGAVSTKSNCQSGKLGYSYLGCNCPGDAIIRGLVGRANIWGIIEPCPVSQGAHICGACCLEI